MLHLGVGTKKKGYATNILEHVLQTVARKSKMDIMETRRILTLVSVALQDYTSFLDGGSSSTTGKVMSQSAHG